MRNTEEMIVMLRIAFFVMVMLIFITIALFYLINQRRRKLDDIEVRKQMGLSDESEKEEYYNPIDYK